MEAYRDLIFDLIAIILAVAATAIALIEAQEMLYNKRISTFILLYRMRRNDQLRISRAISDFHEDDSQGDDVYAHLFYKRAWMHQAGKPLQPLEHLKILPSFPARNYTPITRAFRHKGILPMRYRTLADNLVTFTDIHLFDAPTYAVSGVEANEDGLTLRVHRGSFFDYVNSCFPFEFEAAHYLLRRNPKAGQKSRLRLRESISVFDFDNRFASIGVVTLLILQNVKQNGRATPYFLLHRRSGDVAAAQGRLSIVPAGTFQPSSETAHLDLDDALKREGIYHSLIRELGEEVFCIEEFSFLSRVNALESSEIFEFLKGRTYFLGCGINPLDLHFEVITMAVFDFADEAVKEYFGGDSAEEIVRRIDNNYEGEISLNPFTPDMLYHYENHFRTDPPLKELCRTVRGDFEHIMDVIEGVGPGRADNDA